MSAIDEMYEKYAKFTTAKRVYPEFTAEKQLEIIKALTRFGIPIYLTNSNQKYCVAKLVDYNSEANLFEMALAIFLLKIYTRLSAKEREEVKEILER